MSTGRGSVCVLTPPLLSPSACIPFFLLPLTRLVCRSLSPALPGLLAKMGDVGGPGKFLGQMAREGRVYAGTHVGTDKAGNKYFENNENIYGSHRWVDYKERDDFVSPCHQSMPAEAAAALPNFEAPCRGARGCRVLLRRCKREPLTGQTERARQRGPPDTDGSVAELKVRPWRAAHYPLDTPGSHVASSASRCRDCSSMILPVSRPRLIGGITRPKKERKNSRSFPKPCGCPPAPARQNTTTTPGRKRRRLKVARVDVQDDRHATDRAQVRLADRLRPEPDWM